MRAADIMTPSPCCCSPDDSLQTVARTMRDGDCGAVPILDDGRLAGIVTDRDLVVRGLAEGLKASARVGDLVTLDPCCCDADDDIRDVERIMVDNQVRRVPVVDADGCCVGIVSQADLARAARAGRQVTDEEVAIVVEHLSAPRRTSFDYGAQPSSEMRI